MRLTKYRHETKQRQGSLQMNGFAFHFARTVRLSSQNEATGNKTYKRFT